MKQALFTVACLGFLLGPLPSHTAGKPPVFDIHGPTIVAFFPPTSEAELDKHPDTNEALADFQFYAQQAKQPLAQKGIDFQEVYAHSFSIRRGKTVSTFTPRKIQVGYYFIAPSKKPRVIYGVRTQNDLLQVADEYFGETPR